MTWFDASYQFHGNDLVFAHITDCHLFAHRHGEYFAVNTAENLSQILQFLSQNKVDGVIFGGDLTQDHSVSSYQLFTELIESSLLTCPVFWLPGNHDELALLNSLQSSKIRSEKRILLPNFEIRLVNSKGQSPAGWCDAAHLYELKSSLDESTTVNGMVFCHHHPLPVNGYLDKHILENGYELLNYLANSNKVQTVFHGHVHNDYHSTFREIDVYATPATSIQFKKQTQDWQQENLGPACRLIRIKNGNMVKCEVVWLTQ